MVGVLCTVFRCIIAGRNEVFLALVLRDVLCCGVLVLSKCFVFLYIGIFN